MLQHGPRRVDGRRPSDDLSLMIEAKSERPGARGMSGLTLTAFRLVWQSSPRALLFAALSQLVTACAAGLVVILGQRLLADVLEVSAGRPVVWQHVTIAAAFAGVSAITAAAPLLQALHQRVLAEQVGQRVWDQVLGAAASARMENYEEPDFLSRLHRVQANGTLRPLTMVTGLLGLLGAVAGAVSVTVGILVVAPLLLPILLGLGLPALWLSHRAARTEFDFTVAQTDVVRRRSYLRQLLTSREAAAELRANGSQHYLRQLHKEHSARFAKAVRRQVGLRARYAVVGALVTALALALSLLLLIVLLDRRMIDVAGAGAALIGLRLLSGRLSQLIASASSLFESGPFLRDLYAFLADRSLLADKGGGTVPAPRSPELRTGIRVEAASFRYPGSAEPVLHGVDLEVRPGEVVALVGENGSGKTTLAKLVAGLYEPTGGCVTCDGVDLLSGPTPSSAPVSIVFQDFLRYRLSAGENVALGDAERIHDEVAIEAAAATCGAHEFLTALPHGYRTVLSKEYREGEDLSTGQWQRVALARALFRESPMVILDEPSAALDARSESRLFDDVRSILNGRAALIISHRFSSVRLADRIYVLHEGRVVESGTHTELLARGGQYAELFSLQAKSYL